MSAAALEGENAALEAAYEAARADREEVARRCAELEEARAELAQRVCMRACARMRARVCVSGWMRMVVCVCVSELSRVCLCRRLTAMCALDVPVAPAGFCSRAYVYISAWRDKPSLFLSCLWRRRRR